MSVRNLKGCSQGLFCSYTDIFDTSAVLLTKLNNSWFALVQFSLAPRVNDHRAIQWAIMEHFLQLDQNKKYIKSCVGLHTFLAVSQLLL